MVKHLYAHVPFCNSICSYCDFCHRIYNSDLVDKWLASLKKEIINKCKDNYETIYIGGGTPTSLQCDQLEKLLQMIEPYSRNVKEYTIEVNPESLDINKIKLFNKYHINRISMGVQTSDDNLLKLINRKHTFNDVRNAIKELKENGLSNISIDLMYSLPNQTIDILKKTLDDFISLDVPHVSLYSLTVEENKIFGRKGYKALDEEIEADMYEYIKSYLTTKGYNQYEVSNYSKKGYESKHNLGYWNYDDFLGVSLAASSKIGNHRWTNTFRFEEYLNDTNAKSEDIYLDNENKKFENIMMSLRTIYGLNIENFNNKYNCDLLTEYNKGINNPNINIENGYLKCRNLEILNNVLLDFMK